MNGLSDYIGHVVVVDLASPFVCIGTLKEVQEHLLVLTDADFHDLRDTPTNRENYIADSKFTGVKRNRAEVRILLREAVALSRLKDVIDE
jgi:hypothetical protein